MHDSSRMNVLESTQELVHYRLNLLIIKAMASSLKFTCNIRVHELLVKIYMACLWEINVKKVDYLNRLIRFRFWPSGL